MNQANNIGGRLLRTRNKLGISQTAFAKYFNVNQCTISRWESGEIKTIDARTLFWIEHVLGTLSFVYANEQRASK